MPNILLPIPHQRQQDEQTIYVNDPAFEMHPLPVPIAEFELAWMVFDYRYGVLLSP
jgi:hypothetical protein